MDNRFYSFCEGVAIFSADKSNFYDTTDAAMAAYYAGNGFEKGDVPFVGSAGQILTLAGDAYIDFAREGKQAVVMANWQAHVTYGTGSSSTLFSSCFVGITRDHFEQTTGDLFAYFTDAYGDTNCISKISNQNRFSNYTQYGQILSQTAIDLIKTMDESHIAEFKTKTTTLPETLPVAPATCLPRLM